MNTQALAQFLSELQRNNNKTWFDANRRRYDALRAEWLEFIEAVIFGVAGFDATARHLEAKECTFRINRDIRFSADKSPYKTNFSLVIVPEGKKTQAPAYYMHFDAQGELFVAGGVWMPDKDYLSVIRHYIAERPERAESALGDARFASVFGDIDRSESLTRLPKGFEDDVPCADLVKLKRFVAQRAFAWESSKDDQLEQELTRYFEAIHPLVSWLREAYVIMQGKKP
jgi:uncharacterized protein (TIGR02453 family)